MFRRALFPLIVLTMPFASLTLAKQFEAREVFPEAVYPLFGVVMISALFAMLALPIWFWFFSRFSRGTKWTVSALALVLLAGGVGSIRRVEFHGGMRPIFHYRWDVDPTQAFQNYLTGNHRIEIKLTLEDVTPGPEDFPRYRGERADGVASATLGNPEWSTTPPRVEWSHPVGYAHSGTAIAGKVIITQEQRGSQECVVCYDRATGKEFWVAKYDAEFKHMENQGSGGPRATPTLADGKVYTLGAMGHLVCLDATTGTIHWKTNILEDSGAKNLEWAMTGSPLVVDNQVIVNAGVDTANNRKQAVAAYDRDTGKRLWAAGEHLAGYSSPMLVTLCGVRQVVLFDGTGVAGLNLNTGATLWRSPWVTSYDMNVIQPLILPGDRVFISSEQKPGSAVLHIAHENNAWTVTTVWQFKSIMASSFSNPVYHKGHIFGLSTRSGILTCLNAETGARLWQSDDRFGTGQVLLSGDTLIVQSETGDVATVASDPTRYRMLGRFTLPSATGEWARVWNTPSLAGGRLVVRNHRAMISLDVR